MTRLATSAFLLAALAPAAASWQPGWPADPSAGKENVTCNLKWDVLCGDSPLKKYPCAQPWNREIVHEYLEKAIAVEFFTIPLYLTAGYSLHKSQQVMFGQPGYEDAVKVQANGRYVDTDSKKVMPINNSFTPYELIHATFIDEMYHLKWVANVASAAGLDADDFRRALKKPPLTNGTYLDQLPVRLSSNNLTYSGSGALDSVIKTMVAIETPDPEHAPNPDFEYGVAPPPPPPQSQEPTDHCPKLDGTGKVKAGAYRSISDFYYALWEGLIAINKNISAPHGECDVGKNTCMGYSTHKCKVHTDCPGNWTGVIPDRQWSTVDDDKHGFRVTPPTVMNLPTALANILPIVYEGEGADVRIMSGARVMTERGILPREYVTAGDEVDSTDVAAYTHYDRFLAINKWVESLPPDNKTTYIKSLERHPSECQSAAMNANLQQEKAYNNLLKDIVDGYSNETKNSLPESQWFAHMVYATPSVKSETMALEDGTYGATPPPSHSAEMMSKGPSKCPYANPMWLTSS